MKLLFNIFQGYLIDSGVNVLFSRRKRSAGEILRQMSGMLIWLAVVVALLVFGFLQLKKTFVAGMICIVPGVVFLLWFLVRFVISLISNWVELADRQMQEAKRKEQGK